MPQQNSMPQDPRHYSSVPLSGRCSTSQQDQRDPHPAKPSCHHVTTCMQDGIPKPDTSRILLGGIPQACTRSSAGVDKVASRLQGCSHQLQVPRFHMHCTPLHKHILHSRSPFDHDGTAGGPDELAQTAHSVTRTVSDPVLSCRASAPHLSASPIRIRKLVST